MHSKEAALARPFRAGLGVALCVPTGIDTDRLGTFTGEIPREGSPREVVEAKARIGMDITGLVHGLASEGSFGPHPMVPFIQSHYEHLAFVDDEQNFVVIESQLGTETNFGRACCETWEDVVDFSKGHGFPKHSLIVRPDGCPDFGQVIKGIARYPDLKEAVMVAIEQSPTRRAVLETDMRAHQNPTRMRMLRKLAFRLVRRMNRYCPDCLCPGFGLVDTETGLPCEDCGSPTRLIRWEIHGCPRCLMKKQSLVQMDSLALLLVTATYAIHEEK